MAISEDTVALVAAQLTAAHVALVEKKDAHTLPTGLAGENTIPNLYRHYIAKVRSIHPK